MDYDIDARGVKPALEALDSIGRVDVTRAGNKNRVRGLARVVDQSQRSAEYTQLAPYTSPRIILTLSRPYPSLSDLRSGRELRLHMVRYVPHRAR